MQSGIAVSLIINAGLLLALSVVYEIFYVLPFRLGKLENVLKGCLIGIIALAIMTTPFKLQAGIVFDTRTILIGAAALSFGPVPALIAAGIAIIYRFFMGGQGTWIGIVMIASSAVIGLFWRRLWRKRKPKHRLLNIYLFGIVVHLVMLACTMILPYPMSFEVAGAVALPVLLIYPVGTVLLCQLLLSQAERNEALMQVAEAEERYKSLFDNNHAVMLLIDPNDGSVIDANPAACSFYGWSLETMKTMNLSQINMLSLEKMKEELQKSLDEEKNHFLFKHRRAHDKPVDVEVYSGPIKIRGRTLIYSIIHDISARAAAFDALLESEKRFRLLVEGAPDAIFIQTGETFAYVNQAAVDFFGAEKPEQLIGTPVLERFHKDYHETIKERIYQLNVCKKAVPPNEEVFLKMDGTPVYVDALAVPIHYNGEDGALVFARDITERKNLESSNRSMEAQLRQQQKLEAIGTLAGGVAHEINNPINGIMNYAQLILDDVQENTNEAEFAREIIRETERVSVIVKNLLQFSRQEKQAHSYANVYDIIGQTISLIKTVIKKDQITLNVDLDNGLPDIKCRSQQIQQVLMNLLTNARDALNEKYPDYSENKIICVTCSQFANEGRRWIRIVVEDHGNGIPKVLEEKIFEPFFSTKPKDIGTGLGLSISFGIVKDHHGSLNIDSREGEYTKFILILPVDNGWKL